MQHEHNVGFYDTDEFAASSIAEYLRPSVELGQVAAIVLPAPRHAEVVQHLSGMGIDVERAVALDKFFIVDADEVIDQIVTKGEVTAENFEAFVTPLLDLADQLGCVIRMCGQIAPQMWAGGDQRNALRVEGYLHSLAHRRDFDLLCCYPLEIFDAGPIEEFEELCSNHHRVIPPERYEQLGEDERGRAIAMLQHRCRSTELLLAKRQGEFVRALASRDEIGQAKGILMQRLQINAEQAFAILCGGSHQGNKKLHEVATAFLASFNREL